MKVSVFQPDSQLASKVDVYFNSDFAGTVGRGETISGEISLLDGGPYVVVTKCGFYYTTYHGTDDAELEIRWHTNPGSIELYKVK